MKSGKNKKLTAQELPIGDIVEACTAEIKEKQADMSMHFNNMKSISTGFSF